MPNVSIRVDNGLVDGTSYTYPFLIILIVDYGNDSSTYQWTG